MLIRCTPQDIRCDELRTEVPDGKESSRRRGKRWTDVCDAPVCSQIRGHNDRLKRLMYSSVCIVTFLRWRFCIPHCSHHGWASHDVKQAAAARYEKPTCRSIGSANGPKLHASGKPLHYFTRSSILIHWVGSKTDPLPQWWRDDGATLPAWPGCCQA